MFTVPSHYLLLVLGNVFPEDFFQDFPRGLGEAKWHVPWVSEGVCKIYFFFLQTSRAPAASSWFFKEDSRLGKSQPFLSAPWDIASCSSPGPMSFYILSSCSNLSLDSCLPLEVLFFEPWLQVGRSVVWVYKLSLQFRPPVPGPPDAKLLPVQSTASTTCITPENQALAYKHTSSCCSVPELPVHATSLWRPVL